MINQQRAKNVAIGGCVVQFLFTAVMLVLWLWTGSMAAMASTWFLLGGLGLWAVTAVLFYSRQLERREAMELEELAAQATSAGRIFEREDALMRPAARRLAWMERWMQPIFAILEAAFQLVIGLLMLRYLWGAHAWGLIGRTDLPAGMGIGYPAQGTLMAILITFLGFLFSRYSLGMSGQADWRLLRAPGSYLLVNVLAMAAVTGALLSAYMGTLGVDVIAALAIPALQILLGVELLLNFVLDIYRPRVPGQEQRPSFDSRLLNLIAEPGRIGHSIAETLNYQFGFEVSKTWFYQLLGRAFVPLVLLGAVVLVGMTSIVIVHDGEQYIVMHWGRPEPAPLGAGIHLKWSWPVDTALRFNVAQVQEILLGAGAPRTPEQRREAMAMGHELELWTQEHGAVQERDFLLAVPPRTSDTPGAPRGVSLIKLVVPVQYVITDAYKYAFKYTDPRQMLESVAYREMTGYCASATLDSPAGFPDCPEAIMTYGRDHAAAELKKRIQAAADRLDMGVRIQYVGLLAVHPPADAAASFEEVLEAERRQDEARFKAQAEANEILGKVAGDADAALRLALAMRSAEELDRLRDLQDRKGSAEEYKQMSEREYKQMLEREYKQTLGRYAAAVAADIGTLEKDVATERLLGQRGGEKGTATQQLLEEHRAYLATLRKLQTGGELAPIAKAANDRVDTLFKYASGEPAKIEAQAQADRWKKEMAEFARVERFRQELKAYRLSPSIYALDRYLDVMDKVLPSLNKYVLAVDPDKVELRVNWERKDEIDLSPPPPPSGGPGGK